MLDRYESTELLALIEGELDHASAAALQSRLAKDPQAAGKVAAMMRDRVSLREIEEPALPHDFIATIEPMLSRPMLIEPAAEVMAAVPGEFRRQHRRRTSPRRWARFAVAAGLLLAAMGGAWAAYENWDSWIGRDANGERFARNEGEPRGGERSRPNSPQPAPGISASSSSATLGPGAIHHDLRPHSIANASRVAISGSRDRDAASSAQPSILVADFAVVVAAKDRTDAEDRFSSVLTNLAATSVLVRNFNYGEAQSLAEEYRIAHAGPTRNSGASGGERSIAASGTAIAPGSAGLTESSLSRAEVQQLAQRVREQLRVRAASDSGNPGTGPATGNVVLAGAEALSPTLEQQLDFSSRGATHTIAVPASELVALIERLSLADPVSAATTLRMLSSRTANEADSSDSIDASHSALAWLTDGPLVRQAMQRLSQAPGNAIVLLPVIVK